MLTLGTQCTHPSKLRPSAPSVRADFLGNFLFEFVVLPPAYIHLLRRGL